MINFFIDTKKADNFIKEVESKGGEAFITNPPGLENIYVEVHWIHDKNRDVKQIISGYPKNYSVIQTIERKNGESENDFRKRYKLAYKNFIHEHKNIDTARVYLNNY